MGKASNRKSKQRSAAHQMICVENAEMAERAKRKLVVRDAEDMPATEALLKSATGALTGRIPATFVHEGETYYMRASIGLVRLEIFDNPATEKPITQALHSGFEVFGHKPGH